jgi:hypothetical protein
MLKLPNYMHIMGAKKYGQCPNVWVEEDACKVLGSGFNV